MAAIEVRVGTVSKTIDPATEFDLAIVSEKLEDLLYSVRGIIADSEEISEIIRKGYAVFMDPKKELGSSNFSVHPFAKGIRVKHKKDIYEISYYTSLR